jgi:two-component system, LytTR family, response regulator
VYSVRTNSISIPVVNGTIIKQAQHIIRVQASSNYCRIYCDDEPYPITVARVLAWFQELLPQQDFIRTHRTHLVNRQYIKSKTDSHMLLQNGESICISKRRMSAVKKNSLTNK